MRSLFFSFQSCDESGTKKIFHAKSHFDLLASEFPTCEWVGTEAIWSAERGLISVVQMDTREKLDVIINTDENLLQGILESKGMKFAEQILREKLGRLQYVEHPVNAWRPENYSTGKLGWDYLLSFI